MTARTRKAVGLLLLLGGLALYAALASKLADHLPDWGVLQFGYYVVAGVVWIWPALLLIRWMQARDGF
jgi:hypothetical protein